MLWQQIWLQSFPITNCFQTSNLNHATHNLNFENRSNESLTEFYGIWKSAKFEKNWKNAKNAAIEADQKILAAKHITAFYINNIGFSTKIYHQNFLSLRFQP